MQNRNFINTLSGSIALKIALGIVLTLLLLIPVKMIENLIKERSKENKHVVKTISKVWGNPQTVTGPFLIIPIRPESELSTKNQTLTGSNNSNNQLPEMVFIPLKVDYNVKTFPNFKHSGIYKYVVYQSEIQINGVFGDFDLSNLKVNQKTITKQDLDWSNARLQFNISDTKGISGETEVSFAGKNVIIEPNLNPIHDDYNGFTCAVALDSVSESRFTAIIKLKGSESLSFNPTAKLSNTQLTLHWPSPKFFGSFSPDTAHFDGKSYHAKWSLSQLARPIPSSWLINSWPTIDSYKYGVEMIETVDKYHQTYRSAKYSLLFVLLSFLTLFFFDFFAKKESGLLQYALIGIALVLFYSLLLSLSEHMNFGFAYLISTVGIVGMITIYFHSNFKKWRYTSTMLAFWSILYSFLYLILQLEDFALLAGNIFLFIVLALIMFVSRKMNQTSKVNSAEKPTGIDNDDLL